MTDFDSRRDEETNHNIEEITIEDSPSQREEKPIQSTAKENTERYNTILISGLFILFIALLFIAVYFSKIGSIFGISNETISGDDVVLVKYNYKSLVKQDGMWYFYVDANRTKYEVTLHYNPFELENVSVINNGSSVFADAKTFYITIDPLRQFNESEYYVLASAEISRNLITVFDKEVIGGCYENTNTDYCYYRPLLDCRYNTTVPIIIINESSDTNVEFITPNCVVINGYNMEVVRSAERLIYRWLSIMD